MAKLYKCQNCKRILEGLQHGEPFFTIAKYCADHNKDPITPKKIIGWCNECFEIVAGKDIVDLYKT